MDESGFPQNGDVFYWVRSDTGDICESRWNEYSQSCRFKKNIGNVFRSRVDAMNAKYRQIDRAVALEDAKK